MASAMIGDKPAAQSVLESLVKDILAEKSRGDHDKNYLLLVVEASCQKLDIPLPSGVKAARRVVYPRVSNDLVETYPLNMLVPDLPAKASN